MVPKPVLESQPRPASSVVEHVHVLLEPPPATTIWKKYCWLLRRPTIVVFLVFAPVFISYFVVANPRSSVGPYSIQLLEGAGGLSCLNWKAAVWWLRSTIGLAQSFLDHQPHRFNPPSLERMFDTVTAADALCRRISFCLQRFLRERRRPGEAEDSEKPLQNEQLAWSIVV